jgi:hypothetical protein
VQRLYPRASGLPHVDLVTDAIAQVRPRGRVCRRHGCTRPTRSCWARLRRDELLAPMQITGAAAAGSPMPGAGRRAYHARTVTGFPNLFLLYGPNTNLGHNSIVLMLEEPDPLPSPGGRHLRTGTARWGLDVRPTCRRRTTPGCSSGCAARCSPAAAAAGTYGRRAQTQNWPSTLDFRRRTRGSAGRLRSAARGRSTRAGPTQVPSQPVARWRSPPREAAARAGRPQPP